MKPDVFVKSLNKDRAVFNVNKIKNNVTKIAVLHI